MRSLVVGVHKQIQCTRKVCEPEGLFENMSRAQKTGSIMKEEIYATLFVKCINSAYFNDNLYLDANPFDLVFFFIYIYISLFFGLFPHESLPPVLSSIFDICRENNCATDMSSL